MNGTKTEWFVQVRRYKRFDYAMILPDGSTIPCSSDTVLWTEWEEVVGTDREIHISHLVIDCYRANGRCCHETGQYTSQASVEMPPTSSTVTELLGCPDCEHQIRKVTVTTVLNETVTETERTTWSPTGACDETEECLDTFESTSWTREKLRTVEVFYPDGPCPD